MRTVVSLSSLLLAALSCLSCLKTEVINYEPPEQAVDTMAKKERPMPPKPPKDTTDQDDRVPIGWDATVEDWEENDVDCRTTDAS